MDRDFLKVMEERNKANNFALLVGAKIVHIEEGSAVAEMEIRENMQNPIGSVHGGCIYTLIDIAAGGAAVSFGQPIATQSINVTYLNAVLPGTKKLTARGTVVKRGKRNIIMDVKVEDENGKLAAIATAIFSVISMKFADKK